ncbi:MAG: hypothetical protein SFZ23_05275 [Planctomycetota bacterium]|nr:hypothetical protein [Planctomycetota bacterium]
MSTPRASSWFVGLLTSTLVHAVLFGALRQAELAPRALSGQSTLVTLPELTPRERGEPPPIEQRPPENPPVPPGTPEPAKPEREDEVRAGIEESRAATQAWVGFAEATEHLARQSTVEQSALSPNPGDGRRAGTATPAPVPPTPPVSASPPQPDTPNQAAEAAPAPVGERATPREAPSEPRNDEEQVNETHRRPSPASDAMDSRRNGVTPDDQTQQPESSEPTPSNPAPGNPSPSQSAPIPTSPIQPGPERRNPEPRDPQRQNEPQRDEVPASERPEADLPVPVPSEPVETSPPPISPQQLTPPFPPDITPVTPETPDVRRATDAFDGTRTTDETDSVTSARPIGAALPPPPSLQPTERAAPGSANSPPPAESTPTNEARPTPASAPQAVASPGGLGGRPGEQSDADSDATALQETVEVRPGRVAAAKGLKITTVRPRWSITTMATARPKNPEVVITFGRTGRVLKAEFFEGKTTGEPDVDGPLLNAIYQWTATGEALRKLPLDQDSAPKRGVKLKMRILLGSDS